MSPTPGPLAVSRIALLPDGQIVEAVLDSGGNALARWYSSGAWSRWWQLGGPAVGISVAAAAVSSVDTCYVSVTFGGGQSGSRGIYAFTAGGGPVPTSL